MSRPTNNTGFTDLYYHGPDRALFTSASAGSKDTCAPAISAAPESWGYEFIPDPETGVPAIPIRRVNKRDK